MKDECLICKAPLVYSGRDEIMTCCLCGKTEAGKTKCAEGHYVCDECHTQGVDAILAVCLESGSKNPAEIFNALIKMPFCHTHGPEHRVLVGASLLTAYKNASGDIDPEGSLKEMIARGKQIPGGVCGFWGACGAGISAGIFIAIVTGSTPLTEKPWGFANGMTARALEKISAVGGPRCCKRGAFLAIEAAVDFVEEKLGIRMERTQTRCGTYPENNQCIALRCPFFPADKR